MASPTLEQRLAARARPAGAPAMRQTWAQLLFLHWRVAPEVVQRTLPSGLTVDTFDGSAWLGVVPFFMQRVRPRGLPAVPGLSDFLELNVRTYVHDAGGMPGVWFYSLDCDQRLAVRVARRFFHLPYEDAAMRAEHSPDGWIDYAARRSGQEEESRFRYRLRGDAAPAPPGSREFFLVERYTLFARAAGSGRLFRGRVAHAPYRIAGAEVPWWSDLALRQAGFVSSGRAPDHICGAEAVDVEVFGLERLA